MRGILRRAGLATPDLEALLHTAVQGLRGDAPPARQA
jgi:hypothetical protein